MPPRVVFNFSRLCVGMLITAYSLFWEAIVLLRGYEGWAEKDAERFDAIVKFLNNRARYGPATFRHKVLFLQGLAVFFV